MDPVRGVSQVMDALRRTMSENIETLRRAGRLPASQQTGVHPARPGSATDLRRKVTRRLRSISESDPAFQQKTVGVFVESVLLDQFGENLVNDPSFRELIDQVCTTMTQDEAIASDLRALISEMRKA
jgi:hypothetical protein